MLVTFYNAVTCSRIMFGSVYWGGHISRFDRGRLEKCYGVGKPPDSFEILYQKRLYKI